MKKLMFAFATVLAFATTFSLTSCNEDPCKSVECGTHGTCNAGTCDCAAGYEKDTNGRCDLITSSLYLADYNAAEFDQISGKPVQAGGKDLKYDSSIKAVAGSISKVTIANLGDYLCNKNGVDTKAAVEATVKGDSLSINYTDCNNTWVGKGYFNRSAKTVTINYSNTYPPDPKTPSKLVTDKNKTVLTKK